MSKVIQLIPAAHIPTGLRNIANEIENGEIEAENVTLIISGEVHHLGSGPGGDKAGIRDAMWNLNIGIRRLSELYD